MPMNLAKWLAAFRRRRQSPVGKPALSRDTGSPGIKPALTGTARLLQDRRGAVSLTVAATLPVMISFTALGIDMSNVYYHRRLLQDTASAAALAASHILPNTAANVQAKAVEYAAKNMPVAKFGNVLATADVQIGTWTRATRTFTVTATTPTAVRVTLKSTTATGNAFRLYFANLIGYSSMNLTATATATFGTNKSWDIAIVQDITASLNATDMTNAKAADQSILSCVNNNYGGTSQVSVMSFTGYSDATHLRRGMTAVGTSSNYTNLQNSINGMNLCGTSGQPACSGTNIAAGIQAGLNQFKTSADGGTYVPGATGALFAGKAMIVVTDGAPNWSNAAVNNNGDYGTNMGGECRNPANSTQWCSNAAVTSTNRNTAMANNAIAQANAAAAMGIDVYMIYLDQGGTAAEWSLVQSLARKNGAAYTGNAYTVSNSAQLTTAMFNICAAVPRQLVD